MNGAQTTFDFVILDICTTFLKSDRLICVTQVVIHVLSLFLGVFLLMLLQHVVAVSQLQLLHTY